MWPQPPVAASTISIRPVLPFRLCMSQVVPRLRFHRDWYWVQWPCELRALDQQIDAGLAGETAAADQKRDVIVVDLELGEMSVPRLSSPPRKSIDSLLALEPADVHLIGQRAGRRAGAGRRGAGRFPVAVIGSLEIGKHQVACRSRVGQEHAGQAGRPANWESPAHAVVPDGCSRESGSTEDARLAARDEWCQTSGWPLLAQFLDLLTGGVGGFDQFGVFRLAGRIERRLAELAGGLGQLFLRVPSNKASAERAISRAVPALLVAPVVRARPSAFSSSESTW